jgi:predicted nucleic acid-binding Zn ribbon protein
MFGAAVMSVAAAQTPFELTVDTTTAVSNEPVILQAGEKLEVSLTVNSNPNAAYFSFYLDFDAKNLTIDTDEAGNIAFKAGDVYAANCIKVIYGANDRVKCIVNDLNSNEDNNKTGVLVTFTFTVNEGFHGDAGVNVVMDSADIIDRNFDSVEVKLNNKLATVAVHNFVGEPKENKGDCVTDATLTYKCEKCGDIVLVTAKAPGHKEVADVAVEATCTTEGKTAGSHCSVCNTVLTKQEVVPVKAHTEVVDKAVEPTCTETGLTEGKHCSVCSTVTVAQDTVPAKGHTEVVDAAVDATCTETGLTEGKHCSVCEEVIVAQDTVAAKGHTEVVDEAVEPTYSETGLTEGSHCSVCNEVLKAQEPVEKKSSLWIWIVVIVAVLAVGGIVAFVFIKKKKN